MAASPVSPGSFFADLKGRSEPIFQVLVFTLFVAGLGLAPVYDTWYLAIVGGGLLWLINAGAAMLFQGRRASKLILALVLCAFGIQYLYQMHGLAETRMFFFMIPVLLLIFEDWLLYVPVAICILLHHIVLFTLEAGGNNTVYFSATRIQTYDLAFNLALLLAMIGVCAAGAYGLYVQRSVAAKYMDALHVKLKNTERNIEFANQIAKGNLDTRYELTEGDDMGASLEDMRIKLREIARKEQEQRWEAIGLAGVSEILRSDSDDIVQMANHVTAYLVKYTNANQGGFFTLNDHDVSDVHLSLCACYAYSKKKHRQKKVSVGSGLLGQVVFEKQFIHLTQIPRDYVEITSGLGEATPRALLILPFITNEQVVGALEIASFSEFDDYQISFLQKAAETVAATLASLRAQRHLRYELSEVP
jgi:methyl-accepting chemotaxis protein